MKRKQRNLLLPQAADLLEHEPEGNLARRIATDAWQRQEIIELQIELLQCAESD